MPEKRYLCTSRAAEASAVGLFGKPVHLFHAQLSRALATEIGPEAALLFAEPTGASGTEIDWYTEAEGEILAFADADAKARASAIARLSVLYAQAQALRDRLLTSAISNERQLGNVLAVAMGWPRTDETYLVGDQVVTISWALGSLREDPGDPIIDSETITSFPIDPPPSAATEPNPINTDAEVETRLLAPPTIHAVAGQRLARLVLAGAMALLLGAGALYGYNWWSAKRAKAVGDDPRQLESERAELDEQLSRLRQELLRKRAACDVPQQEIEIPPEATRTGDLRFLMGRWSNAEELHVIGKPQLKLQYSMSVDDRGQGTFVINVNDGRTCRAPLKARFQGQELVIETTDGLPCSGGEEMAMAPQRITCSSSATGTTNCKLENIGQNTIDARFRREGR